MKKPRIEKLKITPFSDTVKKLLRDPETKKAYDALEVEYKLIEELIKIRARKHLTQQQLADKIGVAQPALARFESGRVNPSLSFIQKISAGLGLKLVLK
jgi:DNA-binding XRE family transcriptional regulator